MARLEFKDGRNTTDLTQIREELSTLGIELNHWPLPANSNATALLAKPVLNDDEKNELLMALDDRFEDQKKKFGYQSRDLVVLHPGVPNLDGLLAQFDRMHTHDDDEVRYIVDGLGKFGFMRPDGSQVLLTVESEEYIRVPPNTRHWFILEDSRRIKAVRYFTYKEGWLAKYTGDQVNF